MKAVTALASREIAEKNAKLEELTAAWDLSHGFLRRLDGTITFWCSGSEQVYGWKKEEATGRVSHELLQTEFPKPLAEIESELLETSVWRGEISHQTASGNRIHIATRWVLQRDSDGHPVSVIEACNEITDRLRAEEATVHLAAIVESSSDAIIGETLAGKITSWNTSAEKLFGYTASEIIGESIAKIIPPDKLAEEAQMLDSIRRGRRIDHAETTRLTKAGGRIAVSLTVSPIQNRSGATIGASTNIRDITRQKAIEEAYRESEERQRRAVQAGHVGSGPLTRSPARRSAMTN